MVWLKDTHVDLEFSVILEALRTHVFVLRILTEAIQIWNTKKVINMMFNI